ncbi:MAG TPA: hypothetical protein ENL03_05465 [Phycisphaerae bacterium]|nr:hypothetical protein [Phycisphaerae bacterium]
MKVFLAGIIQGSLVSADIHSQDWRQAIKDALAEHLPQGEVYCHYSEHPNSISYELEDIKKTFAEGNALAGDCDLLIAYCPSASMGTAIEMHEAVKNSAVVLTVSPLAANWVIRAYSDRIFADIDELVSFISTGQVNSMLSQRGR